jgi:hypothetical protein
VNERLMPASEQVVLDAGARRLWARLIHRRARVEMRHAVRRQGYRGPRVELAELWLDLGGES